MTPGVICKHVNNGAPIVCAVREEASHEVDTGWTLLCADAHENQDFMIVDLDRYVKGDQGLVDILTLPAHSVASRSSADQPCVIEARGITSEPEPALKN